jgi:outer membrane protein assembly factor BamB
LSLACAGALPAATPPPITTIASGYGPIYGGVALGPDGVVYFTSARAGTQKAKIVAINPTDSLKWEWEAPSATDGYNMLAVPMIDTAGQRLYIGNDLGELYCLNTANAAQVWKYQVPTIGLPSYLHQSDIMAGPREQYLVFIRYA